MTIRETRRTARSEASLFTKRVYTSLTRLVAGENR